MRGYRKAVWAERWQITFNAGKYELLHFCGKNEKRQNKIEDTIPKEATRTERTLSTESGSKLMKITGFNK